MKKLEGKVAVVTGVSIAKHLAAEGADLVVAQITKNGGSAVAVKANVSNKTEITSLFAETQKAFGRLHILVNNTGIYEFKPLEKIEWHFAGLCTHSTI